MFEHFSDHARRVLDLEGLEARRMHHAYLGTEHLLLALLREPEGHGHRALEDLGLRHSQVRQTLAELVGAGPETDVPDYFRQTPRIKHVMELAIEEARQLKSANIGTEHMLLALLDEPEGVAMKVLNTLGVEPKAVREKILTMLAEERAA